MKTDDKITASEYIARVEERELYDPDPEFFEIVSELDPETAVSMGMRCWSENLYLFPHDWYDSIPEGFEVETINNEIQEFSKDKNGGDHRFGVLSYGVRLEQ